MTTKRRPRGQAAILLMILGGLYFALAVGATEVSFFRQQSLKSFLPGTLEGVGIDAAGRLQLGDDVERLVGIDEPFIFAAAEHPDGWVLGTGNSGRVLLVTRKGEVRTLFETAEPEVFAVWVDGDGTVFAGSSPGGKVYRFEDGVSEEFFDPGETYIWALARHADGRLLAATGTEGRLYAIDEDGQGDVLYDSEDIHIRALKQLDDGGLLLGTAGEGLILLREPDGAVRTLFDSVHPEVVSFASAPGGVCYAAVLASEASVVDLSSGGQANRGGAGASQESGESAEGNEENGSEGVVVIEGALGDFTASRPVGFTGSRTDILSIAPTGVVEKVWGFKDETAYSLLWHRDRLWVGTGLEGKLYSFRDREMVLEEGVDERQVVSLLPADPGPVFATTNAAAFYVVADRPRRLGVYTSPALDAGQIARFGTLRWRGEKPSGAGVRFAVRTGMSAEPDRTWSSWSPFSDGVEVSLSDVPSGRYVQWRVELEAGNERSPSITSVDLSYRQENMAPRIEKLEVLEPGQVLVPANFNPAQQIFEPAHPNREGIFNTLTPGTTEDRRLKGLWKKGYRTLKWQADDANDDKLSYVLTFRPEGQDGEWLQVADELVENYYSFDATVLPDGDYRFRIVASDLPANSAERALTAERLTGPVTIDHSPPELISVRRRGGALEIEVADALSPLREATVSIGAGKWQPAHPVDGLLDGTREVLRVEAPEGAELVLLRIMDGAFNLVTLDLGRR